MKEKKVKKAKEKTYAPKGSRVWVLVIRTSDGITCTTAYHSWRSLMNAVKKDWNERFACGHQTHEFGDAEKQEISTQFFLKCGRDTYLVDECEVG